MDKKEIEIPYGAFDSELMHQEINIPEGFEAEIKGNKIILKKTESEDEKVRKDLIGTIHLAYDCGVSLNKEQHDKAIAWLEKQCKKESKKISIWNHWKDGICGNGEGKIIYLIKDGDNYRLSSSLGCECDYIILSDLDKLKPANKMESFCIPRYAIENIQIAIKVFEKERHAPLANALRETMRRLEERWKPTNLQLECLSDAIKRYNSEGYPASTLKELLEQLKQIG